MALSLLNLYLFYLFASLKITYERSIASKTIETSPVFLNDDAIESEERQRIFKQSGITTNLFRGLNNLEQLKPVREDVQIEVLRLWCLLNTQKNFSLAQVLQCYNFEPDLGFWIANYDSIFPRVGNNTHI